MDRSYSRIRVIFDDFTHAFVSEDTYSQERATRVAQRIAAECGPGVFVEIHDCNEREHLTGDLTGDVSTDKRSQPR